MCLIVPDALASLMPCQVICLVAFDALLFSRGWNYYQILFLFYNKCKIIEFNWVKFIYSYNYFNLNEKLMCLKFQCKLPSEMWSVFIELNWF